MANSLIEGVVPLAGPGFLAKENGNFQPGEYKRLCNLEIDRSGFLINRRNVYSVHGESSGTAVDPIVNPQRFLGNMREYTLLTDGSTQYAVGDGTFVELWNDLSAGPTVSPDFSRFLGFFRYNNKNYWLVFEFDSGTSVALALYYDSEIPVPDVPETYAAGYEASLTREVILTFTAGTNDFYDFQFKNFFLYKERLWIATSVGLYFSAATDPTDFVAPNGGFFKHPGNTINWAFAIKDTVYTLCQEAVYALTYSTDPNLDATERPLSDTIGGEMGVVHLDTPYFINNLGIFAINGNNVDKVMDSRFDYGKDTYSNRIYSFEEYLVVNKYQAINYDNNYSPPARVELRTNLWRSPESDTIGGTQIDDNWSIDGSDAVQTRTNMVFNPSLEVDDESWLLNDIFESEMGRTTDHSVAGSACGYVNRLDSVGSIDIGVISLVNQTATPFATYTASVSVRHGAGSARDVMVELVFFDGLTELSSPGTTVSCDPGEFTRISRTATAPANTDGVSIRITYKSVTGTSRQYWDAAMIEETSTLRTYFDGATTDDAFNTYAWSGSAHASQSTASSATNLLDAVATASDGQPGLVLSLSGEIADADDLFDAVDSGDVYAEWTYTLNPTSAIVNGIPYHFRCEHRAVGTWTDALFTVKFEYLDAGSAVLGTVNQNVSGAYDPSGSYATYNYGALVFPTNTESLRVTFKLAIDPESGNTTDWTVYMNRFHLEKASTYSGYFTGATTDTADVSYSWSGTPYASESTTGSAETHSYLKNNGAKFEPYLEGNTLGYNTYFINTENGATHVLDFMDQYSAAAHGSAGYIVDAILNPLKDSSGNYKLVFLTNKAISEDEDGLVYNGHVYFVSSSEDIEVNDYAVNSAGNLIRRAPKIDVEIDSFVPDGFEYRLKKFRSLMLHGVMPPTGMQLDIAYDNNAASQTTELGDEETVLSQPRRHYAHRIGLNQRGRSLTFRLNNPDWADEISSEFGDLEISDLRVMWTWTGRLPLTKNIGS